MLNRLAHVRMQSLVVIATVLALVPGLGGAQPVGETTSLKVEGMAIVAKGGHLRTEVNALVAMISQKRVGEMAGVAAELRKRFESQFDPTLRQYSFASAEEFQEFQKTAPARFEWIDWGYKQTLQMQAYAAGDRKDFEGALAFLDQAASLAPVSADTAIEQGYVLNQMHKPGDALAKYQRARTLAFGYRSQQVFKGPALRGIGFTLVELKQLDEAEAALRESLAYDPASAVAKRELEYIRRERAAAPKAPAAEPKGGASP